MWIQKKPVPSPSFPERMRVAVANDFAAQLELNISLEVLQLF
jgi:hypothetical protein